MTFEALLEGRRTKVLIDTGSFVTLIDSRLSAELTRARKIETSLKHIEGIGGVMKDVEGAIIIKIKVGKQEIPLKCHIVHNMAYPILMGRDIMAVIMISMDLRGNRIYFKKNIPIKEIEDAGTANKTLSCWSVVEPESTDDEEEEHVGTSKHQQRHEQQQEQKPKRPLLFAQTFLSLFLL